MRQNGVWAWTIDPDKMDDLSIQDVVKRMPPRDGAGELSRLAPPGAKEDHTQPWLIRFSKLPLAKYKGTVGRPGATYVFFSDLSQTWNLKLREAWRRSGATTQELDNQDPTKKVFVWVEAPAENGDVTAPASWRDVIEILKSMNVDKALFDAVSSRPDSLLRRLQDRETP
jgi:hypothetical protein